MRILLNILAVIGILLLILLVLAAICLFYPVSYRIRGEAEEELSLCGRFRWLSGLLRFEFELRDFRPRMQFGILWLNWSFGGEEAEEADTKTGAARREERMEKTAEAPAGEARSRESVETEVLENTASAEQYRTESQKAASKSRMRKKPGSKRFRKNCGKAFQNKRSRQKGVLKEELLDGGNRMAVKHFWQEATYIFTHLKPKYAEGTVSFSVGDPELTGLATGALSLLPVMYQYDACVCPDFISDAPYIRGTIVFGGRMSLYCTVLCLIRIIRDENAMRLIQKFR